MNDALLIIKSRAIILSAKLITAFFRINPPPRVAVVAFITKKNKILCIDLSYQKGLALPGGGIEKNENLEEGLIREVFEETGLKITSAKYFNSYLAYFKPQSIFSYPVLSVYFIVKTQGKVRPSSEGLPLWTEPKKAITQFGYQDNIYALKDYMK